MEKELNRTNQASLYELAVDTDARLLRIKLRGYWKLEVFDSYRKDMERAIQRARSSCGRFHSLVDLREYEVQSAEVSKAHQIFLESVSGIASDRTAIMASKALLKLQASRITPSHKTRLFDNEKLALSWLSERDAATGG